VRGILAEHLDWNATQVHDEYMSLIRRGRLDIAASDAVGVNAIQKHMELLKPQLERMKDSGLDQRWHYGLLRDYAVDPDAMPIIRLVEEWLEGQAHAQEDMPLTLRQALWVSRLHKVWTIPPKPRRKDVVGIASTLYSWARAYAQREIICALTGVEFTTYELDKVFRKRGKDRPWPVFIDNAIIMFDPGGGGITWVDDAQPWQNEDDPKMWARTHKEDSNGTR